MIFADWLAQTKLDAQKRGSDFAYTVLRHKDGTAAELQHIWLDPGKFPTRYPEELTEQQRDLGMSWSKWEIVRCAPQPAGTRISIPTGKFLPGGMPDIVIE